MHESHLLAGVWAHRGWSERAMARQYAALATAIGGTEFEFLRPALLAARDDEYVHADLCDRCCVALGGTPIDAPLPPVARIDDPLLALVITCMGETVNVVLLQDELMTSENPLQALARRLLVDEVQHARIGWEALSEAAKGGSLTRLAVPITGALADGLAREGELAMLDPGRRDELLRAAVEEVLLPGLVRFGIVCDRASIEAPLRAS